MNSAYRAALRSQRRRSRYTISSTSVQREADAIFAADRTPNEAHSSKFVVSNSCALPDAVSVTNVLLGNAAAMIAVPSGDGEDV